MKRKGKSSAKAKPDSAASIVTGLYSRKDVAELVVKGSRHVHSSMLGARDPGVQVTRKCLDTRKPLQYPWETSGKIKAVRINSSGERHEILKDIARNLGPDCKRELRENVNSVLEELVTNAIYHPYVDSSGNPKYPRKDLAALEAKEAIEIRYAATENGVYLSVTDHGGRLSFEQVVASLHRCYWSRDAQIQDKESGAGLGIYMAFETATHMKIETVQGKRTSISCWIADPRSFDPDTFSFNFFEWR